MGYAVKEIFLTLQGEGVQAGRRAVFLRLAGCNLWTGREEDRADAQCRFCDTDFVGMDGANGGRYEAAALAERVAALWDGAEFPLPVTPAKAGVRRSPETAPAREDASPAASPRRSVAPLVVITGGEPMLQLDRALIDALHAQGFEIAVETNGTLPAPAGLDWVCVSPKAGTEIVQRSGNELKLVWPQAGMDPTDLLAWRFDHFLIQPMDGPDREAAVKEAIAFVMAHPQWRLSLQTHKLLGLP